MDFKVESCMLTKKIRVAFWRNDRERPDFSYRLFIGGGRKECLFL